MSERTYTGLKVHRMSIPPYTVGTIDFPIPNPNYFRVQNRGTNKVFCSTSGYPTEHLYDFSISEEKAKLYAQPFTSSRLYVFNPSGDEVEVVCTSFAAAFDPLALALAELAIEMPDKVESTSVISGFNAALPTGNNKIGGVEVLNPVKVDGLLAAVNRVVERVQYNHDVIAWNSKTYEKIMEGTATSGGMTMTPWDGYRINEVCFLSNDGDTDITVFFYYEDTPQSITLKAGEVLNNCPCYCDKITVSGNNVPFRLFVTGRKEV